MQTIMDFLTGGFGLSTVFWICLLLGVVLILLSAFLGDIFDFSTDAGDFGPFSAPVLASFLVAFGGSGLLYYRVIHLGPIASSLAAMVTAVAGSGAVYYGMLKLVFSQEGGTEFEPKEAAGMDAEVITEIPADGAGEITFDTIAGRMSGPARSADGRRVARGSIVKIERFVAGTYIVASGISKEPE